MAITPVRLRKVITGTKQKYFDLDILDAEGNIVGRRLYIANIEKNSNNVKEILELGENTPPSQLTNTCNIFSSAGVVKDLVIRNMFEVTDNTDFETRSYAYANKTDLEFNKADDYSDLFIDNKYRLSSIVGFNDSVFTLTNQLSSVTYYPLDYISNNGNLSSKIIRDPLYTAVFESGSYLENLSTSEFDKRFNPKYLINGIQYNNVIDYPTSVYPLFKDNTLLGNAIICKNHLGYDYSQHSIEEPISEGSNIVTRKFTEMRSYKRLIATGDNLYLVYDNMYEAKTNQYINNESNVNTTIINIEGISYNGTDIDNDIKPDIPVIPDINDDNNTVVTYLDGTVSAFSIIGSINSKSYSLTNYIPNVENATDINVGNDVIGIENYAFDKCKNLVSINIPANVKLIGSYAFRNCENLQNINIVSDSTLETIEIGAFTKCYNLISIQIPASVKKLGPILFQECINLESIIFLGYPPPSIDINTFKFKLVADFNTEPKGYYLPNYKSVWEDILETSPKWLGNFEILEYTSPISTFKVLRKYVSPRLLSTKPKYLEDLNKIEKVEMFNSVNRFTQANHHKSNLYSIEIEDLGLNAIEKTADEKIKIAVKNIKKSITNNIKKICQNTQPGNTQLFSVFFTGN